MDQINLLTFIAIMAEFVPILGITLTLLIERVKHLAEHHHHIDDVKIIIDQLKDGNTSSAATSQGDKEFRFQNTKGLFTYICKDFHLTKEQVMEWFTKHERIGYRIKKAIACDEIAPETGEKHVHIWIQIDERFDTKTACKFFTIDGVTPNIKLGGNPQKAISYCMKGMDYVCYNMDPNYEIKTRKMHQQLLEYQLITKQLNM
ncbi:hypothetical protein INT45_006783 [Circinella minor]|uniref:Uncharacterized protein n=1 Tax=Circinella minor TaxID=1195481 RepID=A0A8H7SAC8_9FUNG|nr:hypothetical protein INT45_006783 [Circinella minor]